MPWLLVSSCTQTSAATCSDLTAALCESVRLRTDQGPASHWEASLLIYVVGQDAELGLEDITQTSCCSVQLGLREVVQMVEQCFQWEPHHQLDQEGQLAHGEGANSRKSESTESGAELTGVLVGGVPPQLCHASPMCTCCLWPAPGVCYLGFGQYSLLQGGP